MEQGQFQGTAEQVLDVFTRDALGGISVFPNNNDLHRPADLMLSEIQTKK